MRWWRLSGLGGAKTVILVALLAGCVGVPKTAPSVSSPPAAAAPLTKAQPAPNPPPPPPPPAPEPERLLGWTPAAVTALFGKPNLVRWEGPSQIYLYPDPAAGCALTMVFREKDGTFQLESLTAHDPSSPDHVPLASKTCLARLLPQKLWPRLAPKAAREAAMPVDSPEENRKTRTSSLRAGEQQNDGDSQTSPPPP